MTAQEAIDLSPSATRPAAFAREAARPRSSDIPDDKAMLRAAVELTRDISHARPEIYWPDMLASAAVGYAALAAAILVDGVWASVAFGLLSALALYRALLFIHELTHIHRDALPGFRFAWNVLVGIPMLIPSLMYEGVHTIHHTRTRYGTVEDPEYLPLALMKPWSLPVFALTAILLPVALLIRSAVLIPLGAVIPPLRKLVWGRASALAINPQFSRRPPEGAFARMVFWQELGCSVWAISVLAASYAYGWRPLLIALCVVSLTAFLNQVRTLVAHLWENDGDAMTVTAQYLDSVNVPPPARFSELWAPVGLRYHALHHLLPSVPYHSLAEAHRRLARHLGTDSTYAKANYPGLLPLVGRLIESTMRSR
ncbi:fatty acid desaturase family protein [Novosphingobium sp. PhB55]|jgi:fatty acid desaturase|uniref:fatty acid desaturase family protein n=1 Tax=unclassified Novosphingobium TaxID=2644732 RepID=UPI0010658A04|nr:fatty acid desaturase [Novosphingobium sp. PhB55]TDW62680.1 fatty acid desaturase [Novosphingobium sp. PhB55]